MGLSQSKEAVTDTKSKEFDLEKVKNIMAEMERAEKSKREATTGLATGAPNGATSTTAPPYTFGIAMPPATSFTDLSGTNGQQDMSLRQGQHPSLLGLDQLPANLTRTVSGTSRGTSGITAGTSFDTVGTLSTLGHGMPLYAGQAGGPYWDPNVAAPPPRQYPPDPSTVANLAPNLAAVAPPAALAPNAALAVPPAAAPAPAVAVAPPAAAPVPVPPAAAPAAADVIDLTASVTAPAPAPAANAALDGKPPAIRASSAVTPKKGNTAGHKRSKTSPPAVSPTESDMSTIARKWGTGKGIYDLRLRKHTLPWRYDTPVQFWAETIYGYPVTCIRYGATQNTVWLFHFIMADTRVAMARFLNFVKLTYNTKEWGKVFDHKVVASLWEGYVYNWFVCHGWINEYYERKGDLIYSANNDPITRRAPSFKKSYEELFKEDGPILVSWNKEWRGMRRKAVAFTVTSDSEEEHSHCSAQM